LEVLPIETYEWYANPIAKEKVKQLAKANYDAGGSDRIVEFIDKMDDSILRVYLKNLVRDNMAAGIEMLSATGGE
jgi:hypothetical protein